MDKRFLYRIPGCLWYLGKIRIFSEMTRHTIKIFERRHRPLPKKKTLFFPDIRENQEYDGTNGLSITGPNPEKPYWHKLLVLKLT